MFLRNYNVSFLLWRLSWVSVHCDWADRRLTNRWSFPANLECPSFVRPTAEAQLHRAGNLAVSPLLSILTCHWHTLRFSYKLIAASNSLLWTKLLFYIFTASLKDKKLIRRWDSERELSLRRHCTRTRKYNRLLHKFHHRSFSVMQVYQIQRNNTM